MRPPYHQTTTKRPELLLEKEAAEMLRISCRELRRLRGAGSGPQVVILPGGQVRYHPVVLLDWIESCSNPNAKHGTVLHDDGYGARLIPFPGSGIKVRRRLRGVRGKSS